MSNQNKFLNNAAVSLPEDYKIYIEALEEQFKENDVKNIGKTEY